jgi:hypothetical protein
MRKYPSGCLLVLTFAQVYSDGRFAEAAGRFLTVRIDFDKKTIAEKKDKAKKLLDEFIRQHPGSTDSEKAKALLDSL